MSYLLSEVKNDLGALLHGTSIDDLEGVSDYSLFRRGWKSLRAKLDIAGSRRIALLSGAIHEDVYDYTAPADFDDRSLIDLRPQGQVNLSDRTRYATSKEFSLRKAIESGKIHTTVRHDDGEVILNVDYNSAPNPITFLEVGSTTNWTASNDATNLTEDKVNFVSGSSSLNYDVSGAGTTATLDQTLSSTLNLSDHDEQSVWFVRHYFPNASAITSVRFRWGNSSSVYWEATATSPFDKTAFQNGWNLLGFDWNGATETGTVDPSAIDYVQIHVTYDGTADTDYRVDLITSSLGEFLEAEYYSTYGFRSSAGTFLETPTADTDIVNVDPDAENLFLYECVKQATRQTQGQDSPQDLQNIRDDLFGGGNDVGLYSHYRNKHPSQAIKIRQTYYRL